MKILRYALPILFYASSAHALSIQQTGSPQQVRISTINSNGNIVISTAANSSVIGTPNIFASGTTGAVSFNPNLSSFTVTGALSGTFANTVLGPCVAGSTVSLTLSAYNSMVHVDFNGTMSDGNLAAVIGVGILVDGLLTNGETNAKGLVAPLEPVTTDGTNVSFGVIVTGLSSGQHIFCLTPFVSAGTGTIDSTNSVAKMSVYTLP